MQVARPANDSAPRNPVRGRQVDHRRPRRAGGLLTSPECTHVGRRQQELFNKLVDQTFTLIAPGRYAGITVILVLHQVMPKLVDCGPTAPARLRTAADHSHSVTLKQQRRAFGFFVHCGQIQAHPLKDIGHCPQRSGGAARRPSSSSGQSNGIDGVRCALHGEIRHRRGEEAMVNQPLGAASMLLKPRIQAVPVTRCLVRGLLQCAPARDECLRRTRHEVSQRYAQGFSQAKELKSCDASVPGLYTHDRGAIEVYPRCEVALTQTRGQARFSDALADLGPALRSIHVCDFCTPGDERANARPVTGAVAPQRLPGRLDLAVEPGERGGGTFFDGPPAQFLRTPASRAAVSHWGNSLRSWS